MKGFAIICLSIAFSITGVQSVFPGNSNEGKSKQKKHIRSGRVKKEIIYKPPFRGAPINRVFGGTRGNVSDSIAIEVLTPERTGLTYNPQPILYWFVSAAVSGDLEFTLNQENVEEPILDIRLPRPVSAGINQIDLSNYDVALVLDIEYQWSIALVSDERNRSRDVVSIGCIKKVARSLDLSSILKIALEFDHPAIYAERGIWYDALKALSRLIESNAVDIDLVRKRADFLASVGLGETVKFERNRIKNLELFPRSQEF